MDESVEFRMPLKVRLLQSAAYLVVPVVALPVVAFGRGDRQLPLLVLGALVVLVVVLIVGVNRARMVLESARLTVVGALGRRVLPRESVIGLTVASGSVILSWRTAGGGRCSWPLTSLSAPEWLTRLVPGASEHRQQFINRVNEWAASAQSA